MIKSQIADENPSNTYEEKRKPVYLIGHRASLEELNHAKEAIEEVLHAANVEDIIIKIKQIDNPYNIENEKMDNGRQIDASGVLFNIEEKSYRDPHYGIVLTHEDLNSSYKSVNLLVGLAQRDTGAVISTYRFQEQQHKLKNEILKTQVMHEIGHVFGTPSDSREENVEDNLGLHCTNKCVMRQRRHVPDGWKELTKDRLESHPYCNDCKNDLRRYFGSL